MSLLDDNFNELRTLVKQGRELNFTSFEPVYYLVFDPSQILEVKKITIMDSYAFKKR